MNQTTRAQQNTNKNITPKAMKKPIRLTEPQETKNRNLMVRAVGNQSMISSQSNPTIQTKLTIGAANDQYEQEADRIADQVMGMTKGDLTISHGNKGVQRKCESCSNGAGLCPKCAEQQTLRRKPLASSITPFVQRSATEHETVSDVPQVDIPMGGGQGLPISSRSFFEPRFGYDFGRVRIHTDGRAARSAKSMSASAYTLGNNIVFGAGMYSPQSKQGRHLLAHELTHVVQQNHKGNSGAASSTIMRDADPTLGERAANAPGQAQSLERSTRGGADDLPARGGTPDPTVPRRCGPAIDSAISTVWSRIESDFAGWTDPQKQNACLYLIQPFTPENNVPGSGAPLALNKDGFDTLGLYQDGAEWQRQAPYYPACGIPGSSAPAGADAFDAGHEDPTRCSNSVTVGGECWLMGTVNYGAFGVMMRLCRDWAPRSTGAFFGEQIMRSVEQFIEQRQRSGETIGSNVEQFVQTIVSGILAQIPDNSTGLRQSVETIVTELVNNLQVVRQLGASGSIPQVARQVVNQMIQRILSSRILSQSGRRMGNLIGGPAFFSRASLIFYVGGYKIFDNDDPGPPLRWALATYDGSAGSVAHGGNRSTCPTTCPLTYNGNPFDYVWEPTRHRDAISWGP